MTSMRSPTPIVERRRPVARSVHLARPHRTLAAGRHGARRAHAGPRSRGSRHATVRRSGADHLRHGRSLRAGRTCRRPLPVAGAGTARAALHEMGAEAGTGLEDRGSRGSRARARPPRRRGDRPPAVPRLELRRSELARDAVRPSGSEDRGPHPSPWPDQRRHRPPPRRRRERHRRRVEPGVVLAARSACGGRAWALSASSTACTCSPTGRWLAAGSPNAGSERRSPIGIASPRGP